MMRSAKRWVLAYALATLLVAFSSLIGPPVSADPHGGGPQVTTGVVYRQGLVLSEGEATPVYAEYDPASGAVVTLLNEFDANDKTLWISSGDTYRASAAAYVKFRENLTPEQQTMLQVVSRDDYTALKESYPAGFTTGTPYPQSNSLLIYRPEALTDTDSMQLDDDKGVIVFESRYYLNELPDNVNLEARSLCIANS